MGTWETCVVLCACHLAPLLLVGEPQYAFGGPPKSMLFRWADLLTNWNHSGLFRNSHVTQPGPMGTNPETFGNEKGSFAFRVTQLGQCDPRNAYDSFSTFEDSQPENGATQRKVKITNGEKGQIPSDLI